MVPQPNALRIPLAIAVARQDGAMAAFINSWIELKRQDGTLDRLYRQWILGADAVARAPRWSIIRNVLHWVRSAIAAGFFWPTIFAHVCYAPLPLFPPGVSVPFQTRI